jgi:Spy/CpxP family protein refolding chaperone
MINMSMKKMVAIMVLSISAVSFAKTGMQGNTNMGRTGKQTMMQQQMVVLTPEQQKEFYKMNDSHMKQTKSYIIQMRETDLDMQKELLKDKPNIKKLNKLSNKKAAFEMKMEKEKLNYRIQMKEKFGVDSFQGNMNQNMMNNTNRSQYKRQMTPAQEQEFRNQNNLYRRQSAEYRLQMREINTEMHREMLQKNPDMKKLEMLTEKKIKLQSEMEKNMLRYRVEMNEKYQDHMIEYDENDEIK